MNFIKKIQIEKKEISQESQVYIIAEAGVNHNGRLDLAMKLVDIAKEAGADAVKFQLFKAENLILKDVEKAPYQKKTERKSKSQYEMLKSLELSFEDHAKIYTYCQKVGITYLCTPYDEESLEFLVELGVPAIKVASTDTTNLLFLEQVALKRLPVILSTGMSNLWEITKALETLYKSGCKKVILLHCTSNYPVSPEEVNLRVIPNLKKMFDVIVGFSDHTEGVGASPFAVALGAKVIEKHFTIDKNMEGPDHKASLSPSELKKMIEAIRYVEKILGNKIKEISPSERDTKPFLQKYLVAKTLIKKGEKITKEHLTAKRTGGKGIPPSLIEYILGRKANQDILENEPILFSYLE